MDHALAPRRDSSPAVEAAIGAALIAIGIMASLAEQQALLAGLAGAAGLAIWRRAWGLPVWGPIAIFDFVVFAVFAFQRNDHLVLWQLVGPWADVFRFNATGAAIAYASYLIGKLFALTSAHRTLRYSEAFALLLIPFLFNMLVALGADWHMAEIAKLLPPFQALDFRAQVFIGRTVTLFGLAEVSLAVLSFIALNRWLTDARLHALLLAAAALGAATPLIANAAQLITAPVALIAASALAAAIAQASLWSVVYVATGLPLDALAGRPPSWLAVSGHWRTGFVKGAIYGGVFMALVLTAASALAIPGVAGSLRSFIWVAGPFGGALAFPFAQTLIGSADGTPPFFGRLRHAYRDRWAYVRGVVVGFGLAYAFQVNLPAHDGGVRFLVAFVFGALAYAGVDAFADYLLILERQRTKMQSWRKYALGALTGGVVAGAIGWYFDVAQVEVVTSKFWAYADVNYRLSGRHIGDFVTYPIFNKYGAINLGEVAGGARLFWAESVSGVINWSLAAPLFSINFVLLSALIDRSLRPFRDLFSARGAEG